MEFFSHMIQVKFLNLIKMKRQMKILKMKCKRNKLVNNNNKVYYKKMMNHNKIQIL